MAEELAPPTDECFWEVNHPDWKKSAVTSKRYKTAYDAWKGEQLIRPMYQYQFTPLDKTDNSRKDDVNNSKRGE